MISSISQRSPPKTCGLFDTGFAGDVDSITSFGLSAPTDRKREFGLAGPSSNVIFNQKNVPLTGELTSTKDFLDLQDLNASEDTWDILDDLSATDPLGNDSLDAFINLDQYFMGNSFFEEDDNLTLNEPQEVDPVIQPSSFIDDLNQSIWESDTVQDVCQVQPVAESYLSATPSRKRKANASKGVKTSLFEIVSLDSTIPTESEIVASVDAQLDHDYTAKKCQKMSVKSMKEDVNTSWNRAQASTSNSVKSMPVITVVEEDLTTVNKQSIRRIKNNVASKRSREQRKQKFVEMDQEADELVQKNDELREKIVELERLAKEMKQILVAKMAGK